jgi:hypothetical protein
MYSNLSGGGGDTENEQRRGFSPTKMNSLDMASACKQLAMAVGVVCGLREICVLRW